MQTWIAVILAALLVFGAVLVVAPAGEYEGKTPQTITAQEAENIALQHAGLRAEQVTGLRSVYDREDGDWDVEFWVGRLEYDYEVHSITGKILERDRDYD